MPDPAIREFFTTRKEEWIKKETKESISDEEKTILMENCFKKFTPEIWLPDAAKRAGQIKFSSHPCTFSHPSARKNTNGYVTPITSNKKNNHDGYVRTGNIKVDIDALGNAAALDVYKFLTLLMNDGTSLIKHIENDSDIAKQLLNISTETYTTLKEGFMAMVKNEEKETITSSKIKQVYFPIDCDNYHLLSILTNSGIVYEMRNRIDSLRFSEEQKTLRETKRKNEYAETEFKEVFDILTIGYGGTKPQNISVLNNQYGGKARLFLSIPPLLEKREIRFPRNNFFIDSIRYYHIKEPLQKLHGIFKTGVDSVIPRRNLESGRDNRIEDILDQIIMRMSALRSISSAQYFEKTSNLPTHQKMWLIEENDIKRNEQDEWLHTLCKEISKWIIDAYKKTLKNPVPLGSAEQQYIEQIIEMNREALR